MDRVTAATLKVIIDGQAWLYANFLSSQAQAPVTQEQFEEYENDWKQSTAELVNALLEGETEIEQK